MTPITEITEQQENKMEKEKENPNVNPSLVEGENRENLSASLDKEHTSATPLHTTQANRDQVKELSGIPGESEFSNSNIQNYLGSEKLNERLATETVLPKDDEERKTELDKKLTGKTETERSNLKV